MIRLNWSKINSLSRLRAEPLIHRGNSRYKDETAAEEMLRGPRYGRCEGNSSPAEGRDTCRNQVYLTFNSDLERCW
jgi:hypothetical protein